MYYRGYPADGPSSTCYAESPDGVNWVKPSLGLVEDRNASTDNNIILPSSGGFSPFIDTKPGIPAAERYKACTTGGGAVLMGWVSHDAIRWRKVRDEPIVPNEFPNNFDAQTAMFWSEPEQRYVMYARHSVGGRRAVTRATSADFLEWTPQVMMTYSDTDSVVPSHQLYDNQTRPYFRAPHIYAALPARFMPRRRVLTTAQCEDLDVGALGGGCADISETVFMTTRPGTTVYDWLFLEGFVRPGMGYGNWVSRTNYAALGIVPTGETEMSIYVLRAYGLPVPYAERLTLRTDGFVSVSAPYEGGEMLTKPLRFTGNALEINYSTGAAGRLRVEIQDAAGQPISGFALGDSTEIIGDEIERVVSWSGGQDVSGLAGQDARLRFVMRNADLYAIRFR